MMRSLLTLALLLTPAIVMSQSTPPAPPAPLSLFAKLVGEWEGEATAVMGPGARHLLRQTERVEAVAGATAFAVRGRGFEKMADGREQMTFDAFAVIYLDHDHATPRMRTFTMQGGNWADPEFTLTADGYQWSMRDPRAGLIRYEMKFDQEGRWVETGAVSRDDGATWFPIFEMKLRRVK
ncbi:DUF1579 family protein [Gemmatimonas groenlandica]|uniref:DUF1579 family protein n=1 Tax=Gemmatimonas groenlandica TaxID=2732249 RepID=A0A6M4IL29_9BACT|nr:DUF1579 family protein [Gemmatimonas groenlandica]QJR35350.1 DUF1579 family protein [Gemmatimonas groenlandica]